MQLDYYRLSDRPFELSPDPKFLFLTAGYQEALETVLEGIIGRKGLIVLTGEAGTGKTMLIYSLLARLPGHIRTALIFHSTFNFKEMLEQIYAELGGSPEPGEIQDFKIEILDHLRKLRDQGEVLAVFIDEAQKLSQEVMRGFLYLLDAEPWISEALQLVLVGQTEYEEVLNTALATYPRLHSPRWARIPILSRKESLEYIEHRLKIAGRSSAEIFSPRALSAIIEYSEGIPRLINVVCDNALFTGCVDSLEKVDLGTIRKIIHQLEGPGGKTRGWRRDFRKFLPVPFRSRLSARRTLGLLGGLSLAVLLLLCHTEAIHYLKSLRGPTLVNVLLGQKKNPDKAIRPPQKTLKQTEILPPEPAKPIPSGPREKPGPPIEEHPPMRRIKAKAGENLSTLILQHYGKINESLMNFILYFNPGIKKVDFIMVDQEIQWPELRDETLIIKGPDHNYFLYLGTFINSKKVQAFKTEPVLKGKNITIQPKILSGQQTGYQVEAGMFENQSEALEVINTLRRKKLLPLF